MAKSNKKDKDHDTGELANQASEPETKKTEEGKRSVGASALAKEVDRLQAAVDSHLIPADPTSRLNDDDLEGIPESSRLAFGAQHDNVKWYRKLPISMGTAELPKDVPRWRIEIEGLGPAVEPIGLDILGDAVMGRGRVGTQPADLDLDQFGALEQGVSRRHALLRPTANHLYIIDLGSTNGTLHNGLPLGPGIARSLKHNDAVTLGRLSFTVKLIDGPSMHRTADPSIVVDEGERTKPLTAETGGVAKPYTAATKTDQPKVTPEVIEAHRREQEEKDKKRS
jgi:FHA domain-containing protein